MVDRPTPLSELLEMLRAGTEHLVKMARELQCPFDPSIEDLRKRHNMYVRNLVMAYVSKFAQLSTGIIGAVESQNYLIYALCGRAVIENTALLRYYVTQEYRPLFAHGRPADAEIPKLLEIDDRHLRGGNFDWQSFLLENYSQLRHNAARRLEGKKSQPPAPLPGPKHPRIGDCIKSWAHDELGIQIVYDLFCDLVHPNVGSSFLVASTKDFIFYFSQFVGNPVGRQIVAQSFLMLLSSSQPPFGEYVGELMQTTWPGDLPNLQPEDDVPPN